MALNNQLLPSIDDIAKIAVLVAFALPALLYVSSGTIGKFLSWKNTALIAVIVIWFLVGALIAIHLHVK